MFIEPSLRSFSSGQSGETRSVIIEVMTAPVSPPQRVLPGQRLHLAPQPTAAIKHGLEDAEKYDALGAQLAALDLSEPPVRLDAIGSFVADLNPEQLRRVMDLPLVAALRENRTHRVPKSKLQSGA